MFRNIRKNKFSKILASYLAIQLITTAVVPTFSYALTSGPSQPEFNSFTPIGTSDMVNLASGDFNYNIPIMDVGGYPLNLSYNSGITMDQEASWVGLGWNLNVGQIARNVRGIPDDFNGDLMQYENKSRENRTLGVTGNITGAFFGVDALTANIGLGVSHNTFSGYTPTPSIGVSYKLNENVSLGVNFSSSIEQGPTVSPNVSLSSKLKESEGIALDKLSSGLGLGYNARQGLQNFNLSSSYNKLDNAHSNNLSGGISFNDNHFTPRNRAGLQTESFSFTASGGSTVVGVQIQGQLNGYGSYQKIQPSEEDKLVPSYGYQNTQFSHNGEGGGILDVNRLNDGVVNKNSNVLSVPNYTYDNYAIQGQGIGGSFRPYRGQVSYLYDRLVSDTSDSGDFGFEIGGGNATYNGFEVELTEATAVSQKWETKNFAINTFKEHADDDNPIDFEPFYFKSYGEFNVDPESILFNNTLLGEEPVRLSIEGEKYNRRLEPVLTKDNPSVSESLQNKIIRNERQLRNTAITTITNRESAFDSQVLYREDAFAKAHHTAGMKVLKPDGSTYVFGEAAYNTTKIEASFDVSKKLNTANCETGLIDYNSNLVANRSSRSDGFLNKITTPAYAHSYLLSSVLSADYEDLTDNGPTDDDLGSYTKFTYKNHSDTNFKWRIPFDRYKASYNEGLKSHKEDEKANYIYGEKELKYIHKIETKTHVALFKLSDRDDAKGVLDEHGGLSTNDGSSMKRIDKIYLFSKPEYTAALSDILENDDPSEAALMKATIKIAHFNYSYDLCPGVNNNSNGNGKLTLNSVYFTYRGSYMGKHTPYVFNYADFDGDGSMEANYPYDLKGYNVWGGYKPNEGTPSCDNFGPLTTMEYPFVEQDKEVADEYARAWTLSSIDLPSGGKMEVQIESDDYQYVQEREAMQMFKVVGAGDHPGTNGSAPDSFTNNLPLYESKRLYNDDNEHYPYLYVRLADSEIELNQDDFIDTYLKDQLNKPIFFRFLLNMFNTSADLYDYVEGYFLVDEARLNDINIFNADNKTYVALPMEFLELEGVSNGNQSVNPISKAGWYFGRQYLRRLVYGDEGDLNTDSFGDVVEGIVSAIEDMSELAESPNGLLEQKGIAKYFIENKSWIRLVNPTGVKYGGGCRVSSIKLYDQWDQMAPSGFQQFYGQEYKYTLEDEIPNDQDQVFTSSGVATFEPNVSKENPYVEPFYGTTDGSYRDKIAAPKESNYVERPIAASFYPSATVTYSKVTVSNLEKSRPIDGGELQILKKHATGKVITEHYTSKDFPTHTSFTSFDARRDTPSGISQVFNFSVKNHLTASQGFVVETNDMNGKMKRQQVYAENKQVPISGTEYIYSVKEDDTRRLDNLLTTINEEGEIENQLVGTDYEVVNDFRENNTRTSTGGVNFNLTTFFIIIPGVVPLPLPTMAKHETILRTASTMKHVHKNGVLLEKKAFDLGSNVTTKNIAWDSKTGEVLLTQTTNEYDDDYYNFNYPVHWYDFYKGMGQASQNLGISGQLSLSAVPGYFEVSSETNEDVINAKDYLIEGDELFIEEILPNENEEDFMPNKYWVAGFDIHNNILLMDIDGLILDECAPEFDRDYHFKVDRSGYRNQQTASMASITSMRNPLDLNATGLTTQSFMEDSDNPGPLHRIINASAVRYKEYWPEHYESNLKPLYLNNGALEMTKQQANPFVQNMKAEWRALASYAYLTGRDFNTDATVPGSSPRNEGFFSNFTPFYRISNEPDQNWEINTENWTFASSISKYSPYGIELENVDALNRYSGAQYGYNYTLPVAVGSNTKFQEMGFNGFEEGGIAIVVNGLGNSHHFGFSDGTITNKASHSGDYSVAVTGAGNAAIAEYPLLPNEIFPREVECEVDDPIISGEPTCQGDEFIYDYCTGEQNWEFPTTAFSFGPSGPSENNSALINLNPGSDPSFGNYYVVFNAQSGQLFLGFPQPLDSVNNGKTADFNLTLNSENGESSTCRFYVTFSLNPIGCD